MQYGAHLPLIDLDGRGWTVPELRSYLHAAEQLGFDTVAANDHLAFQRPWLDGMAALAWAAGASETLNLATTAALPVVRGPAAVAKAAAAIDLMSGGRLSLGLGAGSSRADYALADVDFDQRWPRFEEAVRVVRAQLGCEGWPLPGGRFYSEATALEPRPARPGGPPIWIASWGSPTGLRRVARLGDGWLASAYNTTPDDLAVGLTSLRTAMVTRPDRPLRCVVATMWTMVIYSEAERAGWLARLSSLLGRPGPDLAARLLIGSVEHCAGLLQAYANAGADLLFSWPLADHARQLERVMTEVAPLVRPATGS